MIDKTIAAVRRGLIRLIEDEALFLFAAFLFAGVLSSNAFKWYRESIDVVYSYALIPWGLVLCAARLRRASERRLRSPDVGLLTLLVLWVTAPFGLRFGATFNNVTSWYGHLVVVYAVYAMAVEEEAARRERMFDGLCAGFALLAYVYGGALLYCAATAQAFGQELGGIVFGMENGMLWAGYHYNITGMVSICMMMMCLAGANRRKNPLIKALHILPAGMMALVIVLTQSRTSRYAMLIALAVGAYGALAGGLRLSPAALRHAAALAAAAGVLVGGYFAADALTDAAIAHYNRVAASEAAAQSAEAGPEAAAPDGDPAEGAPAQETKEEAAERDAAPEEPAYQARSAVDGTFSDRLTIWKNLFALWKENPKYLLIGNGIGRTGSRIVEGTIHEKSGAVAVHNTYLQLLADFGVIGFALQMAFFLAILGPVLRVFFARGEAAYPGGRALCMLVIAILATGMMESAPLGMMTPMNLMLYYALAVLCARGRATGRLTTTGL